MKTLHYSIIAILAFTIIMIFIIEFPLYRGPSGLITGSKPYQDNMSGNNIGIIDEQKAKSLAENSVSDLKDISYGCSFDSLSGIYKNDSSGSPKLQYVRVGYDCIQHIGSFVILEDPQMTRVLNVTTYSISNFGPH